MGTVSWKCPNCGGGLKFDPASQKFECEYCMSQFSEEDLERLKPSETSGEEAAKDPGNADSETEREAVVYICPSCGAEIVTDQTTVATLCFYCQNPVVLQGKLEGTYQPDYVLPFAVDKEKATGIFFDWLKKKKFVPADFYGEEQLKKMTGVYFPYWLYSCQVEGKLEAEGTKLRIWQTGNMRYTETQRYDVSRSGQMQVKNVTRNALKKADKQLVEGVMPFEMARIKPFSMEYLSGFLAEKRDMERQIFEQEVQAEVRSFALDSLKSSIGSGYSSVSVRNQNADLKDPVWKYALLPVWTLTYKNKKNDKIYYFACNGQTGKVCGKLPVDAKKLWIFFAEIFLPLLVVLLIAGYMI